MLLILLASVGPPFVQWCVLLKITYLSFVATAITPYIPANGIDHSQCLRILAELFHSRVFIDTTSLSLAAKEFLERILADTFTEKALDSR